MLKYRLIHPELIAALAQAGHGDYILLADSNFPAYNKTPEKANIVYLNLAPGVLSVTQILEVLLDAIPVEAAAVMAMADGGEAPVVAEFRKLLPAGLEIERIERFAFYDTVNSPRTVLVIATGEQRLYANLLLTVGVVNP
jgi:L-fucose mutarotase